MWQTNKYWLATAGCPQYTARNQALVGCLYAGQEPFKLLYVCLFLGMSSFFGLWFLPPKPVIIQVFLLSGTQIQFGKGMDYEKPQ